MVEAGQGQRRRQWVRGAGVACLWHCGHAWGMAVWWAQSWPVLEHLACDCLQPQRLSGIELHLNLSGTPVCGACWLPRMLPSLCFALAGPARAARSAAKGPAAWSSQQSSARSRVDRYMHTWGAAARQRGECTAGQPPRVAACFGRGRGERGGCLLASMPACIALYCVGVCVAFKYGAGLHGSHLATGLPSPLLMAVAVWKWRLVAPAMQQRREDLCMPDAACYPAERNGAANIQISACQDACCHASTTSYPTAAWCQPSGCNRAARRHVHVLQKLWAGTGCAALFGRCMGESAGEGCTCPGAAGCIPGDVPTAIGLLLQAAASSLAATLAPLALGAGGTSRRTGFCVGDTPDWLGASQGVCSCPVAVLSPPPEHVVCLRGLAAHIPPPPPSTRLLTPLYITLYSVAVHIPCDLGNAWACAVCGASPCVGWQCVQCLASFVWLPGQLLGRSTSCCAHPSRHCSALYASISWLDADWIQVQDGVKQLCTSAGWCAAAVYQLCVGAGHGVQMVAGTW